MTYSDPQKKTVQIVDAGPVGLGAMLTQDVKVISLSSLRSRKALLAG